MKAYKIKPNILTCFAGWGTSTSISKNYRKQSDGQQALKVKPDDPNVRTDLGLTFYLRDLAISIGQLRYREAHRRRRDMSRRFRI
jgi:hypothetical protein